ncbi:hypothetical protein CTEN210_11897 [Chaetoceros tenuissimus]|uniref:Uncharacterized protein n=1 Tax=Chaetoceros tenuissimus TaxID=426638 RepID=A0AAD3D074_9STRA|nr:hypothetical protein CTEN210_11897 [Chaetoceros tenuissimus]
MSTDILTELNELSGGSSVSSLGCPAPLVPMKNIIRRNNSTFNSNIPRIFHISFKSRCLPQDIFRTVERWTDVLPNYSIFFHDDEAVERLIQQHWKEFPLLHDAVKCILFKGAMKIDLWRTLILYKYGGVYSDIDMWPSEIFTEKTIRNDLSAFFFVDGWNRPSQWFMATEPSHPIMYLSVKQIIHNLLQMKSLRKPRVVFVTGPEAVKTAYFNFLAPKCCNGTMQQEKVLANNIEMEGPFGKKVIKIKTGKREKPFIYQKYQYGDMVVYNSTLNITRLKRIELESGVIHWATFNHRTRFNFPKQMSCLKYIESLSNGEIEQYSQI